MWTPAREAALSARLSNAPQPAERIGGTGAAYPDGQRPNDSFADTAALFLGELVEEKEIQAVSADAL